MDVTRRSLLAAAAMPGLAGLVNAAELGVVAGADHDQSKVLQAAIAAAEAQGAELFLAAGRYRASGLRSTKPLRFSGVPGATQIRGSGDVLAVKAAKHVTLSGLNFSATDGTAAAQGKALVSASKAENLTIRDCQIIGESAASGLVLKGCSGRITDNHVSYFGATGILALDSIGLEISGNTVSDIGNNGIQVWRSAVGEDGTIVTGNRVSRIGAKDGGSGQNGNGINVYRAGHVLISANRVTDCAYSAIRNNSGANCQIINNSISRTDEVAIYVEFAFEGALICGNLIEDVGFGISITNLDQGGRLAVCANNLVRRAKGGKTAGVTSGGGIYAEADTVVNGNVVEDARDVGIALGWGQYCRNLSATANLVRNCGKGITVSIAEGAEPVLIANNTIVGSKLAAVMAMRHLEEASGDLGVAGAEIPAQIMLTGNLIR